MVVMETIPSTKELMKKLYHFGLLAELLVKRRKGDRDEQFWEPTLHQALF